MLPLAFFLMVAFVIIFTLVVVTFLIAMSTGRREGWRGMRPGIDEPLVIQPPFLSGTDPNSPPFIASDAGQPPEIATHHQQHEAAVHQHSAFVDHSTPTVDSAPSVDVSSPPSMDCPSCNCDTPSQ